MRPATVVEGHPAGATLPGPARRRWFPAPARPPPCLPVPLERGDGTEALPLPACAIPHAAVGHPVPGACVMGTAFGAPPPPPRASPQGFVVAANRALGTAHRTAFASLAQRCTLYTALLTRTLPAVHCPLLAHRAHRQRHIRAARYTARDPRTAPRCTLGLINGPNSVWSGPAAESLMAHALRMTRGCVLRSLYDVV